MSTMTTITERTMRYPRLSRAAPAALFLALAACGPADSAEPESPDPEPTPVGDEAEPEVLEPTRGEYACHIEVPGQPKAEASCTIEDDDLGEGLWLDTLDGDVWLSGVIEPKEEGSFELAGDLFCPQGACDEEVDAVFRELESGVYEAEAELEAGALTIRLERS